MLPIFAIRGLGMGAAMPPMTTAVMNSVGPQRAGLGRGNGKPRVQGQEPEGQQREAQHSHHVGDGPRERRQRGTADVERAIRSAHVERGERPDQWERGQEQG